MLHKDLEAVSAALDGVAKAIISGWSGEQTFCETWGWNCPAVTRHDAAALASSLAAEIRATGAASYDEQISKLVRDLPRRLQHMQASTIPQFWGGNNGPAYAAYATTIQSIRRALYPVLGWQTITDPKALPGHIARRLRSIQAEVDALNPNKDALAAQIKDIEQAHEVAESLPLDLKALAEARDKVVALARDSEASAKRIDEGSVSAAGDLSVINRFKEQAEKLVAQCEDAYRITTTKGLAAAFDQRAGRLSLSMSAWVLGLLAALSAGTYLGSARLEVLTRTLSVPQPQWQFVWLHAVLSILSIGAPVWFAWIATKQIGQRFKLAEDYAFKASVAKAYEGYRKEAARLDPQFELRLFGSALTRLEEAPLRLVEVHTHGSPWQEALSSPQVQKVLDAAPELKDRLIALVQDALSRTKSNLPSTKPD